MSDLRLGDKVRINLPNASFHGTEGHIVAKSSPHPRLWFWVQRMDGGKHAVWGDNLILVERAQGDPIMSGADEYEEILLAQDTMTLIEPQ